MKIVEVQGLCPAGWAGCVSSYTRGHYCIRPEGHKGAHRCECDARTTRKDALAPEDQHRTCGQGER